MRRLRYWKAAAAGGLLVAALFGAVSWQLGPRAEQARPSTLAPLTGLEESSEEAPLSYAPILSWDKDTQAVVYELEVYADAAAKHGPSPAGSASTSGAGLALTA